MTTLGPARVHGIARDDGSWHGTTAQRATIKLVDVAAEAGIDLVNVSGGPAKDYIVDANGNGAAFFDYDNDDDLDVLIVNGSTRERFAQGGDPMVALYQNDGRGRFRDVTAASGFDRRGWGSGACVGDYRQRRREGRLHHRVRRRRAVAQHREGHVR